MKPGGLAMQAELRFAPLTPENWSGLERLFGPKGACGGCWCMAWRLSPKNFREQKGEGNRQALLRIVSSGAPVGVLAYRGDEPVAWCAVGPREATPRLENSKVLARIDDQPVWSVTCLFVARRARRQGLSAKLLSAAAEFAASNGARIVEGYPSQPKDDKAPDAFVWTGLPSAFERAGFEEVARRSPARPIMRRVMPRQPSPARPA
jgi:GNAT superfamily N-acetyltransferase